jgi:hypothetical protein
VNSRRIVTRVGDDLLENRAQDLLLQPDRCLRVIPCPIQIAAQGKQLGAVLLCKLLALNSWLPAGAALGSRHGGVLCSNASQAPLLQVDSLVPSPGTAVQHGSLIPRLLKGEFN